MPGHLYKHIDPTGAVLLDKGDAYIHPDGSYVRYLRMGNGVYKHVYSADGKEIESSYSSILDSNGEAYTDSCLSHITWRGEGYVYLDENGAQRFPGAYRYVKDFSNGYAGVGLEDGNWGVINKGGNIVIPLQYPFYWPLGYKSHDECKKIPIGYFIVISVQNSHRLHPEIPVKHC